VRHCGHLPLAIRIAGARLAARPHWPPARLAELLADERGRLDALNAGDLDVRSSLALSYRGLTGPQRRTLRLLACLEARDVGAWVAAPLLDTAEERAEELMEDLAEARLLDVRPGPDGVARFGLHDLVRGFARELSTAEDPWAERSAALARAFGAWLALAEDAAGRLAAGFRRIAPGDAPRWTGVTPPPDPVDWLEAERPALVATVLQAAREPAHAPYARDLACALARFFELREHLDDWAATSTAALAATRATGDRRGEAHLLRGLGELALDLDRLPRALDLLEQAGSLLAAVGDLDGRQHVLRAAGTALRMRGEPAAALDRLTEALDVAAAVGDEVGRAQALHGLGVLRRMAGQDAEAERHYREALAIFAAAGDPFGEAYVLCSLGLLLGRGARDDGGAASDEAERHLRRSVELCRQSGYRRGEALALGHLGDLHGRRGEHHAAAEELRLALEACREVRERPGEAIILHRLGELHRDLGDPDAARVLLRQALALTERLGMTYDHERARVTLSGLEPAPSVRGDLGGA
ncbi:MAG TPA: tetratricopeptide repeat protein, partial [Pseudonocardiaceae bacterium]